MISKYYKIILVISIFVTLFTCIPVIAINNHKEVTIMANKYCNLIGGNSIKDEFNKITEGFDKVETDNNGVKAIIDKHVQGTAERHKSEDINYDGAVGGANNLKDALDYLDERVDQIITTPAEGVSAQEIIDARKGKISLGEKIDEIDTRTVDLEQNVESYKAESATKEEVSTKAEKTYVDTLAASLASGSPKGVYATLAELETAHQTGNSNIYLVISDGNWYYWNGSEEAWTAGGVYQAPNLGKTTIANLVQNPNFESTTLWANSNVTNFLASNNELTFTATARFGHVRQNVSNTKAGNKYYVAIMVKSSSPEVYLELYRTGGISFSSAKHSGSGNYELLSIIAQPDIDTTSQIRIVDGRTSGFDTISIKQAVMVNVTEGFGKANEPTTKEFEQMIKESNGGSHFFITNQQINVLLANNIYPRPITLNDTVIPPLYVKIENEEINVVSKYSESKDIRVRMRKKGPNNIFDFAYFYLIENTAINTSNDLSVIAPFNTNSSDWFAPYRVAAVNNIDGDNPSSEYFTGGNHGYNNTGSTDGNSATGRTTEIRFFIDGREVSEYSGYANYVKIQWINRIQAYNTSKSDGSGREVIEERYSMIFDGVKWLIKNEIEALEDLTWKAYYGLQCQRNAWKHKLRYESSTNRKWLDGTLETNSGDKNCTSIIMKNIDEDYVEMGINPDVDLGKGELRESSYNAFTSTTKSYFGLVSGDNEIGAGDVFSFEGYYKFYIK